MSDRCEVSLYKTPIGTTEIRLTRSLGGILKTDFIPLDAAQKLQDQQAVIAGLVAALNYYAEPQNADSSGWHGCRIAIDALKDSKALAQEQDEWVRREAIQECIAIVQAEEELDGAIPEELDKGINKAFLKNKEELFRHFVRTTKKSIIVRLQALQPPKQGD